MLDKLFKKYRTIGIVANTNEAKTSLALQKLIELREHINNKIKIVGKKKDKNSKKQLKRLKEYQIYIYGVEPTLHPYLKKKGLKLILNSEDVLDLKLTHSFIYIDEINTFFNPHSRNRQTEKLKKFINRIYHLDDYLICSTAESGYWNKLMNDFIKCFIVKRVEFDSLVMRTRLRRQVIGLENKSDYRLDIPKNTYFILSDGLAEKGTFEYNPNLDSKKDNTQMF